MDQSGRRAAVIKEALEAGHVVTLNAVLGECLREQKNGHSDKNEGTLKDKKGQKKRKRNKLVQIAAFVTVILDEI
jgi:hypothetical protein